MMETYVKYLILPVLQLQTQQVMTSLIRSHIEFLIDLSYSYPHFVVVIDENPSEWVEFNAPLDTI